MTENMNVHEAINAVMRDVTYLAKKDKNTHQGFNFRGIDSVLNICGPAMRKHGLIAYPRLLPEHTVYGEKPTKNSKVKTVDIVVEVVWRGPDGSELVSRVAAEAFDSGDKATAKAMSVGLRTAYLQTLCLPTNEPDPDSFSYQLATNDEREAFLERIQQINNIPQLRDMQREAKRVNAYEEWKSRGEELTRQLNNDNDEQQAT